MTRASQTFVEWVGNLNGRPRTEPDTKPQGAPVSCNEHTVLVVDDDAAFVHLVSSVLRKHGFNVLSASSGAKGLNMIACGPGDIRVVLLDYSMPQLDGEETLNFVRQLSPNAKVIGVTAVKLDSVPKAYRDGVDKLLTKPVIAAELIGAVHEVLGDGQPASSAIQS
jgi:CheY-like chemotaxis protein